MALYSDVKMFHFPEKLQNLSADTPLTPPLHIRIKPTNMCNHRCRYCSYLAPDTQLGKDMCKTDSIPHDKMLEICRDIVRMDIKAVTYSGGGEPLLYPHLLEASQILHEGGVKLACLTNGVLLRDEIADFFAYKATWVRVSMDGWDDASYMHYRGVKGGEYTKILQNLDLFARKNGICVLGVNYIVDGHNAAHILPALTRLKNVGVRSVKVSICIVSNDPQENSDYHAPHFSRVKESISYAKSMLEDATFDIHDGFYDMDTRFAKEYTWCPYMQIQSIIGADMRVYACHDKAYNLDSGVIGSLREQSLREFWQQRKEAFLTIQPHLHCHHHCIANSKNKMLLDYLAVRHVDFV